MLICNIKSKTMKRVIQSTVLFLLLSLLFACDNSSEKTIGLLVHTTNSLRWNTDVNFIKERANELGMKVILCDADNDENLQLRQAKDLLTQGVDVLIVVAANQNTAAGIVRSAHEYKVPVIGYDRLIRNADLDYLVSFEYNKVGNLLVQYVSSKVPNGNCIVLYGDANDGNAVFVKNGISEALKNLPVNKQLNIEYEAYVESWSYENSNHIMKKILDFTPNKIDAIIACNDALGIGAFDALIGHGYMPNEVIITGQDATSNFVESMLKGGLTMSVYKPIKELAYGAVDISFNLANKKEVFGLNGKVNNGRKDIPAMLFSPSIVDESNYKEMMK